MDFVRFELDGVQSFSRAKWSKVTETCALITPDSLLRFFDKRGKEIYSFDQKVSYFEWNNTANITAVGQANGIISITENGYALMSKAFHKSKITNISWHPTEDLFISIDSDNVIAVWKIIGKELNLMKSFQTDVEIIKILWEYTEDIAAVLATNTELYVLDSKFEKKTTLSAKVDSMMMTATNNLILTTMDNKISVYPMLYSETVPTTITVGEGKICITEITKEVIAYSCDGQIYIWNIKTDITKIIRLKTKRNITSLIYSGSQSAIYATSDDGTIVILKSTMIGLTSKLSWRVLDEYEIGVQLSSIEWSSTLETSIASSQGRRPFMIQSVKLNAVPFANGIAYEEKVGVLSYKNEKFNIPTGCIFSTELNNILVSSEKTQNIFSERSGTLSPLASFSCQSYCFINGESVISINESVEVRNFQGTIKQTVSLPSKTSFYDVNTQSIGVLCTDNSIHTFDTKRRVPKQMFSSNLSIPLDKFRIKEFKVSSGGNFLSILVDRMEFGKWIRHPNVFIHIPQLAKTVSIPIEGRCAISCHWDPEDARLFAVVADPFDSNFSATARGRIIIPMFVSNTGDVFKQTSLAIMNNDNFCSLCVPYVYVRENNNAPKKLTLPQFEGVDNLTDESRKALLDFNYNLATGSIDDAFNCVRATTNKATWRSLAQVAAQAKRLDLAVICLAKLEDPTSLLLSKIKDPIEAQVYAAVALGLTTEANKIANESENYEVKVKLALALGDHSTALNLAFVHDRMHIKTVQYQIARHMEIVKDIKKAIKFYGDSGTLSTELPRLASSYGPKIVFDYLKENPNTQNKSIIIWAARFLEAQRKYDKALEKFEEANDVCEIIRLLCIMDRWKDAKARAIKEKKPSAMCLFARLLIGKIQMMEKNDLKVEEVGTLKREVIDMFRRAKQFAPAMTFAMENAMIDDVLQLSYSAPKQTITRAAEWFTGLRQPKNAILMYSRAGQLARALQLCFDLKQYDALDEISDSLDTNTNPRVLVQISHYLAESERWSKAAQCLAYAGKFDDVIELCNTHNIKLRESVIQQIAETKLAPEVAERFAVLCEQQSQFEIASKLYIKIKQYNKAIKALVRAGKTDKIIKMANIIKKKETYILAANYLQTLGNGYGTNTFTQIVDMYKKAKAPDQLAKFYDMQSQIEVEEKSNYDGALELTNLAFELLTNMNANSVALSENRSRSKILETFISAREGSNKQEDVQRAMTLAIDLLKQKDIEKYIKPDDVYIILVNCYVKKNNFNSAYKILNDLDSSGCNIEESLDISVINSIYKAVGKEYKKKSNNEDDVEEIDDIDVEDIVM